MNVSIRKSKHQKEAMTDNQFEFAVACVAKYRKDNDEMYRCYSGTAHNEKIGCDVYKTKTQISAVVYKG